MEKFYSSKTLLKLAGRGGGGMHSHISPGSATVVLCKCFLFVHTVR